LHGIAELESGPDDEVLSYYHCRVFTLMWIDPDNYIPCRDLSYFACYATLQLMAPSTLDRGLTESGFRGIK